MKISTIKIGLLFISLSFLLWSCVFETATTIPGADKRLDYTFTVTGILKPQCVISIRLTAWPISGPRIFQAPKYYADNPALPVPGLKAKDITVTDVQGHALLARDTTLVSVDLGGNFIVVPIDAQLITYTIDLDPLDSTRFGIPFPETGSKVQMIDGAYFFLVPLVGNDLQSQWRTPVDFRLHFVLDAGQTLVGSDPMVNFKTNYELMFVRATLNPLSSYTFSMHNHEVTLYSTANDSLTNTTNNSLGVEQFRGLIQRCISLVEDSLLPLPTYRYAIGENSVFYGIEGVQGYWFKKAVLMSSEVHIHELIHTFVGVYNSDVEDPWWKEGMTDYLGNLLPLQTGLMSDSTFIHEVLAPRDTFPAVLNYGLSSPYVRAHLFAPVDSAYVDKPYPENFVQLVYGKGAQASMIIDRFIYENSKGKKSVFDLVRDLYKTRQPDFTRQDLIASVSHLAGKDATLFLHSLLDQAAPLNQDSLSHTFAILKSLGRFSPGLKPNKPDQPNSISPLANISAAQKKTRTSLNQWYQRQLYEGQFYHGHKI